MNFPLTPKSNSLSLRQRAEKHYQTRKPRETHVGTDAEMQKLLQELDVHQIELEMQNLELTTARDAAEEARNTYADLYNFAPIGYFTLDKNGTVQMANITGAAMLGTYPSVLVGHNFAQWISPRHRTEFTTFLAHTFNLTSSITLETSLLQKDSDPIIINVSIRLCSDEKECRIAVIDTTAQNQAEEKQRLLDKSSALNQELHEEIEIRKQTESKLIHARQELTESLDLSQKQHQKLKDLSHALLKAQEDERKRISRELHDSIAQSLVGIQYQLELISSSPTADLSLFQKNIASAQSLLSQSADLIHHFALELRPSHLDDLGLSSALSAFSQKFSEETGIEIELDFSPEIENLSSTESTMFFRVTQEACSNVFQHAHASKIQIRILKQNDQICMEITDNGIGIKRPSEVLKTKKRRLGLIGMEERVNMVDGTLEIDSVPGEYSTIRVCLPIPENQ
jgi:PAS domain S-box-containing protein